MTDVSKTLQRRYLRRAVTLENKAIELFMAIEEAFGEDSEEASFASGAMTSCVELLGVLGGRAALTKSETPSDV